MIINASYFVGKINLPQVGDSAGLANVQLFINQYEPEYLQRILGYDLWKVFTEGEPTDPRWEALLGGEEYIQYDKTRKFEGLAAMPSPIAQYIYYHFMEDNAIHTVLTGTTVPKTANAIPSNPVPKLVQAWNDMVKLNRSLAAFLNAKSDVYPEWNKSYVPTSWVRDWFFYGDSGECGNELYMFKNSLDI